MYRVFSWLLNGLYAAVLAAASPWIVWTAVQRGKYREGFAQKLLGRVPRRDGNRPCVWLHAVSVGEVNLLATTINVLQSRRPEWQVVISTTTKTGYDLAVEKYADQTVFYCPLDFSWAVHAAMRRVRPDLLVLAELELWPNLILAAKRQGARIAIINGRLSANSFRGYRRIRPLVARVLRQIDLIAAQNQQTAERFQQLGAPRQAIEVTGSVKFDGAQTDRANPQTQALRALAGIAEGDTVLLAGSTQAPEEAYALAIFQALLTDHPRLRLVIVPRHPHRFDEVAQLLNRSNLPWQRRSELETTSIETIAHATETSNTTTESENNTTKTENNSTKTQNNSTKSASNPTARKNDPTDPKSDSTELISDTIDSKNDFTESKSDTIESPNSRDATHRRRSPRILLVDTIGELGAWWGTASVGFVGGSLGDRGGQNMLEPAAYGVATSFGPNTRNFRDIVAQLLAVDGAVVVQDQDALRRFVRRALEDPHWAQQLGDRARKLVLSQQGATQRTVDLLVKLMESHPAKTPAAKKAA